MLLFVNVVMVFVDDDQVEIVRGIICVFVYKGLQCDDCNVFFILEVVICLWDMIVR